MFRLAKKERVQILRREVASERLFLSGRREDRKREEKGTPELAILHGREERRVFFFARKERSVC